MVFLLQNFYGMPVIDYIYSFLFIIAICLVPKACSLWSSDDPTMLHCLVVLYGSVTVAYMVLTA